MEYPRVLVISNNSFSKTDSNGRTLGNLFSGWPKDRIAQFCISTDGANFGVCDNYYCVSDREMLRAFLQFRKARGHVLIEEQEERVSTGVKGKLKTATKAIARHMIWSCNRWKSREFVEWFNAFNPEAVLLQYGDSAFMIAIARKISTEKKVPLLMFNSEGYCFFQNDWMRRDILSPITFPIYRSILRRETCRTMRGMKFAIHLNQLLKEDFDKAYGVPSAVIYTGSDFERVEKEINTEKPKIVYLGNFGFNRPVSLAVVAKVLRSINPSLFIDVYGKPRNDYQEGILENSEGVVFHGPVPYEEVKAIIRNSDVLLHVEGIDDKVQESLRYGFSTKIADSLSSGIPFLLFSRPEIACARYIKETGAGWFASNENELRQQLTLILNDEADRKKRLLRAKEVAEKNHNIELCRKKFQDAVIKTVKKTT